MGNNTWSTSAQLRRAAKLLVEARQTAAKDRELRLHIRYEQLVLEGKMTVANAVKAIEKHERRQQCFRLLKGMTKPTRMSGRIDHIIVTKPYGTTKRIQERKQLEETLHKRNETHFAQANGTPFTQLPLSELLDFGSGHLLPNYP
jgi:hypothetical protein